MADKKLDSAAVGRAQAQRAAQLADRERAKAADKRLTNVKDLSKQLSSLIKQSEALNKIFATFGESLSAIDNADESFLKLTKDVVQFSKNLDNLKDYDQLNKLKRGLDGLSDSFLQANPNIKKATDNLKPFINNLHKAANATRSLTERISDAISENLAG